MSSTNLAINKLALSVAGTRIDKHAQLEKAAGNLVAQTFFGTLLKQMRNSPFKDELFSGGRGGQAFGEMYDQRLAENMTRGAGKKLIRAIVRKFEGKRAYEEQSKAKRGTVPLSRGGR
jgi:Rod binding domain-containing protein